MKRGFTLVELSIVFVIIGLLVAGVLAAESMITTSKVSALTMQIGQFDAGVENFKTKYNYLPGDAPAFNGNADGVVTLGSYSLWVGIFGGEILNFWNNIFPAEVPTPVGAAVQSQVFTSTGNKNVVLSKLGSKNAFFIASGLGSGGNAITTDPKNYYAILDGTQVQTQSSGNWSFSSTTAANSAIKPADLLALDTKMDDGLASSGNVISGSTSIAGIATAPNGTICSNGPTYYLTSAHSGYECTPLIRIGTSANELQ